MGVVSNLMLIRKKFRAIVGANWDGTTLATVNANNIKLKITEQPTDTSATTTTVRINCFGCFWQLYRVSDTGTRTYVTQSYSPLNYASITLASITETTVCCVGVSNGQSEIVYSDNFTVTRTAAQTQSLKMNATKGEQVEAFDVEQPDVIINKEEI